MFLKLLTRKIVLCIGSYDKGFVLNRKICKFTSVKSAMKKSDSLKEVQKENELTLILLFTATPTFANSVDPDQMSSEEAI